MGPDPLIGFLVGAGASVKAGIPLAVADLARFVTLTP
jgi:hypothetical protein